MKLGAYSARVFVSMLMLALGVLTASAEAEGCTKNEQIRTLEVYASRLPDCRAYEEVSPPNKNLTDAVGLPGFVQASPSGERVNYFSLAPFQGTLSPGEYSTYISTGTPIGWSTEGLMFQAEPGALTEVDGFSEDLSRSFIGVTDRPIEPSSAGDHGGDHYVRDNTTGTYRLLVHGLEAFHFADSTPDGSRIIFEDNQEELIPGIRDEPKEINGEIKRPPYLYEWNGEKLPGEQVSLVGVLPSEHAPELGAVAGAGGPLPEAEQEPTSFYTQSTISEDGSRVFFSDAGTGQIYVRENGVSTVQVSKSRGGPPEAEKPAYWRGATPDGKHVFFTSEAKLTSDATASSGSPDLYRFDTETEVLEDLTIPSAGGADVRGTLGISSDGSYAYFVASRVLAEGAQDGRANLYVWHEGGVAFIAYLGSEDESDWRDFATGGGAQAAGVDEKSSRVTPSGTDVLFGSTAPLTGYDNAGFVELYLYEATSHRLVCVSCNPGGVAATAGAYLTGGRSESGPVGVKPFLTRNLSDDGSEAFFQTEEALVGKDTNGQTDVYEWEREGAGSCHPSNEDFSPSSDGCLSLISTGQSSNESYFGDASSDGSDVFFFTRQQLVSQDVDNNADVYDAREDGGMLGQNPAAPGVPCKDEACRGAPSAPPALGGPSSAAFPAVGDLSAPSEAKSAKPKSTKPRTPKKRKPSRSKRRRPKSGGGRKKVRGRMVHVREHSGVHHV